MKRISDDDLVRQAYREIYKNAIPPADFDELMANSPKDSHGRVEIPWRNYEIDEDLFEDVLDKIVKEHKLKPWKARALRTTMILGATPLFSNRHL